MEQSEQQHYSEKYGYAGTLDLLGELPTGPALIDAKSTVTLYPTVGPQTAAYAELVKRPKINRYALMLSPDGNYELKHLNNRGDWSVFLAAITIHNWRKSWN